MLAMALVGCSKAPPCPEGAKAERVPDPDLDGGVAALCRTAEGRLDGPVTLSYDAKRPRLSGRYSQNRPVGPWTWWYPDGTKRASYGFVVEGNYSSVPTGAFETWHPNGKPHWSVTFQNGAPLGPVREQRADGTKRFEGAFAGGRRSGVWTTWYPGGAKAGEGHYEADKPAGRWTVWEKNGAVARVREGTGEWKDSAPDSGAPASVERPLPTSAWDLVASEVTVTEGGPVNWGPPEYVPPLSLPDLTGRGSYFPWEQLHGVWFAEFRIELRLRPEDLE